MNLSQFQQVVGHRRGSDAGPGQAGDHGREVVAPVEAIFELGEVSWHVFGADGPVGADDGGLDVAKSGVDPFEGGRLRGFRSRAGSEDRVAASGARDGGEAGEAVANDGAGGIEALLGEARNRGAAKARDAPQLQANGLAFRRGLDGGDERRLAGGTASALAARARAADVGIVDLDAPAQPFGAVAFEHDLTKFVLDLPGGGLRHPEASTEFDAGDPLLGLGQVIEGAEPDAQLQLGRGENRPGDRRSLRPAGAALIKPARLHDAVPRPAAFRTNETVRPARRDDRSPTLLLGPVEPLEFRLTQPFLELNLVARHRPDPLNILFVHCLYQAESG